MIVTYGIIIFTVVASIVCFNYEDLFNQLKFNAFDVKHSNQWYRFFSYGFLHSGWVHLIINMIVLYSFGQLVENSYKSPFFFGSKYILYYILFQTLEDCCFQSSLLTESTKMMFFIMPSALQGLYPQLSSRAL